MEIIIALLITLTAGMVAYRVWPLPSGYRGKSLGHTLATDAPEPELPFWRGVLVAFRPVVKYTPLGWTRAIEGCGSQISASRLWSHRTCGGCRCHQMHVGFEAQIAPEGLDDGDHPDPHIGIEIAQHFAHGLQGGGQQDFQQRTLVVEERTQDTIGGEREMEMRHIQQVPRDGVDPRIDFHLAATGAESGFAGEGSVGRLAW